MGSVHHLEAAQGLVGAVTTAIEAMHWLGPSDAGTVALALEYARQIDAAGEDDLKAVGWIGQNLAGVLKSLGGTPAERKALGVEDVVRGKLAAIRAGRA